MDNTPGTTNPPVDANAPLVVPCHPFEAAVLLSSILMMGLELMFAAFFVLGSTTRDQSVTSSLTDFASIMYHPEREVPIYLVSVPLILSMGIFFVERWRRLRETAALDIRTGNDVSQALTAIILGVGLCVACYMGINSRIKSVGVANVAYAVSCLICVALQVVVLRSTFTGWRGEIPARILRWYSRWEDQAREGDTSPEEASFLKDGLIAVFFFLLIFIPDTRRLAGLVYLTDAFHHWNYYVVAPSYAYGHGLALGRDVYSQYGSLWAILFGGMSTIVPLSYSTIMSVFVWAGSAYWAFVYLLLHNVIGIRRPVSILITAVGIYVLMFTGLNGLPTIWVAPGSTVIRSPLDIFLFASLWKFFRDGDHRWWLASCILVGFGFLFETDTGIYMVFATLVALANYMVMAKKANGKPFPAIRFLLTGSCAFLIVALLGLFIGSRGSILERSFWLGWVEPMAAHGSGMSFLLIEPVAAVLIPTFLILFGYLFCVSLVVSRIRSGIATRRDLLAASVGIYGLSTFLIFIGRSHPANLSHPILPLGITLAIMCEAFVRSAWHSLPVRQRGVFVIAGVAVFGTMLIGNDSLFVYPNLFNTTVLTRFRPTILGLFGYHGDDQDIVFTSDAQGRPDIILPQWEAPLARLYQAGVRDARARSGKGENLAVVSNDDVTTYLAASARPSGRYSPLLPLLYRKQQIVEYIDSLRHGTTSTIFILTPRYMVRHIKGAPDESGNYLSDENPYPGHWPMTLDSLIAVRTYLRSEWKYKGESGLWEVYER